MPEMWKEFSGDVPPCPLALGLPRVFNHFQSGVHILACHYIVTNVQARNYCFYSLLAVFNDKKAQERSFQYMVCKEDFKPNLFPLWTFVLTVLQCFSYVLYITTFYNQISLSRAIRLYLRPNTSLFVLTATLPCDLSDASWGCNTVYPGVVHKLSWPK